MLLSLRQADHFLDTSARNEIQGFSFPVISDQPERLRNESKLEDSESLIIVFIEVQENEREKQERLKRQRKQNSSGGHGVLNKMDAAVYVTEEKL